MYTRVYKYIFILNKLPNSYTIFNIVKNFVFSLKKTVNLGVIIYQFIINHFN